MSAPDFTEVRRAFDALAAQAPPNVSIAKARESLEDALAQVRGAFSVVSAVIAAKAREAAQAKAKVEATIAAAKAKKDAADHAELLRILRAEKRRRELLSTLETKP